MLKETIVANSNRVSSEIEAESQEKCPYRSSVYTPEETAMLREYMHEDVRRITFVAKNRAEVTVEFPPEEVVSEEEWERALEVILLPELEELHIKSRKRKTIIRFTDKLYDPKEDEFVGGVGQVYGNEHWMRIAYKNSDGTINSSFRLLFVIMHEIIEQDFWDKTLPDDQEANDIRKNEQNLLKNFPLLYRKLLDERVASRRAIKALRRLWPEIDWSNPEDIYEEDK